MSAAGSAVPPASVPFRHRATEVIPTFTVALSGPRRMSHTPTSRSPMAGRQPVGWVAIWSRRTTTRRPAQTLRPNRRRATVGVSPAWGRLKYTGRSGCLVRVRARGMCRAAVYLGQQQCIT